MTGTLETKNKTVVLFDCDKITFKTTQDLLAGQEVYISADNTVSKRTAGNQYSIGTVSTPADTTNNNNPDTVVVKTSFASIMQGVAKGGTLTAGGFVRQNGNITADGLPEYVTATAGELATGIVIIGGAVDAQVRIGVLEYNKLIS